MKNRYWRGSRTVELFREDFRAILKVLDDHAYEPVNDGKYGFFVREDHLYVQLHGNESSLCSPDSFTRSDGFWGARYVQLNQKVSGRFLCAGVAFAVIDGKTPPTLHVIAALVTPELLKELLNRFWSLWQASLDGAESSMDAIVDEALAATEPVTCAACQAVVDDRDHAYHVTGPNVDEAWYCGKCWHDTECPLCGRH